MGDRENELHPLATAKGAEFLCELCREPARFRCSACKLTFYCSKRHLELDFASIHHRLCEHMMLLRKGFEPPPLMGAIEEAKYLKQKKDDLKKQLLELTVTTGERLMFENNPLHAIPAALQSLRFSTDLYGPGSYHVLPSYCLLADASLALGRVQEAQEYLVQARWAALRNPDTPNLMKHRLHRVCGFFAANKKDYEQARKEFADDVYYAALEYGERDIHTVGGYFYLAKMFNLMRESNKSNAFLKIVTDIICEHLSTMVRHRIYGRASSVQNPLDDDAEVDVSVEFAKSSLNEVQAAETFQLLKFIREMRSEARHRQGLCKTAHCLAMLHFLLEDPLQAVEFAKAAMYTMHHLPADENENAFIKDIPDFFEAYSKAAAKI